MLNLLLLEQATTSDGAPLLNWRNPAESRLLDLGKDPEPPNTPTPKWRDTPPFFTADGRLGSPT